MEKPTHAAADKVKAQVGSSEDPKLLRSTVKTLVASERTSPLCSSEELNIIALFGALSATLALELPLHHVRAADAAVRVVDGHGEGLEPDD